MCIRDRRVTALHRADGVQDGWRTPKMRTLGHSACTSHGMRFGPRSLEMAQAPGPRAASCTTRQPICCPVLVAHPRQRELDFGSYAEGGSSSEQQGQLTDDGPQSATPAGRPSPSSKLATRWPRAPGARLSARTVA
eukprot:2259512-Pyramimonas_sp.AAC.1